MRVTIVTESDFAGSGFFASQAIAEEQKSPAAFCRHIAYWAHPWGLPGDIITKDPKELEKCDLEAIIESAFINAVNNHILLIQENPKLFALTDYQNVRSVLIVKQITLFYRIKINTVELIRFWNNHQNPKRLKI